MNGDTQPHGDVPPLSDQERAALGLPPSRIVIGAPRGMSDARIADLRSWAADMQAVFGLPVVVQRPYGPTFQEWPAQAPEKEMGA